MLSHGVTLNEARWQERYVLDSQEKDGPASQPASLREEVYRREVTDRELMYNDSFSSEWARLSNYSPDDFE